MSDPTVTPSPVRVAYAVSDDTDDDIHLEQVELPEWSANAIFDYVAANSLNEANDLDLRENLHIVVTGKLVQFQYQYEDDHPEFAGAVVRYALLLLED